MEGLRKLNIRALFGKFIGLVQIGQEYVHLLTKAALKHYNYCSGISQSCWCCQCPVINRTGTVILRFFFNYPFQIFIILLTLIHTVSLLLTGFYAFSTPT